MASSHSSRSFNPAWAQGNEGYAARPLDPQQPVLSVMPLNSVPYTGPPPSSTPIQNEPAMIFLPSHTTEEELERAVAATSHGVAVTGVAALGKLGRPIGSVDISESNDTYMFRVALPGVARDEKTFSWYIEPNGKIFIKGVTTTGEKKVVRHNMVFEMLTQNLCPPGDFTLSFQLPGPIDHTQINAVFGTDGIFEVVVKKRGDILI